MATTYPKWQNFLGGVLDVALPAVATVVTDGVTTNASTTITSATAAFLAATDVGVTITGTGIPANATIASVTNATTAVLSAAATATGTAITFTINRHLTLRSAALAAMVAVVADDYMKVVLDPDGLDGEPEIVYVSAHTTSATTATIVRGQEGTTARAHRQDVPWVHTVVASDVAAVSPNIDTRSDFTLALGASLGYDEEFNLDGITTAPTNWAWLNQGAATYLEELGAGVVTYPASAAIAWRGLIRAIPSESTWTAYAKVSGFSTTGVDSFTPAVILYDGTKVIDLSRYTNANRFYVSQWNSVTSYSSSPSGASDTGPIHTTVLYFRVKRNSATSYDFAASADGVTWAKILSAHNVSTWMTPTHIGFGMSGSNSAASAAVGCHWFRVR